MEAEKKYLDADLCSHESPAEGDGIHVAGDPVDLICLSSPVAPSKRGEV